MKKKLLAGVFCVAALLAGCEKEAGGTTGGTEVQLIPVSENGVEEGIPSEMPEEKGPSYEYRGEDGKTVSVNVSGKGSEMMKTDSVGQFVTVGEDDFDDIVSLGVPRDVVTGEELLCLAEDEAEAKAIAQQYGITLVKFSQGVATFHTDEDLSAVIQRGKDNGWTPIEINHMYTIDDPKVPISEIRE